MAMSVTLNSKDHIVNSMAMFELYRQFATEQQCQTYNKLCREVWDHEKENVLGGFNCTHV
ncbi:hypothetical protein D3C73_1249120 [compost metagenome]